MESDERRRGRKFMTQYTLYGDKLAEAVANGTIDNTQASMALLEFANQLDSAR